MFALPLTDTAGAAGTAAAAELRPLEPWQAAEFARHIDRARDHLTPWLPWVDAITDQEAARDWLQAYADRQAADEGRIFGLWRDGELVGGVLFRIFDAATGVCEIGVWVAPEAEGSGVVTRAARQLIRWAFEARGMARVEWLAFTSNTRSEAVAKRLGMTCEGVRRQAFPYRGVRHDVAVWALLADEWRAQAATRR